VSDFFLLTLLIKRRYTQGSHNKSHLNLLHAFDENYLLSISILFFLPTLCSRILKLLDHISE